MNIPAAFLDVRHEYEDLIHQQLRAVPRYSAGVNVHTAHNKIEPIRKAFETAEEVLAFFEKHAIQAVSFHVHDSLRHAYEHPSISERRYSRDDMSAWLNEATVTSAAMHLWRSGAKDAGASTRPPSDAGSNAGVTTSSNPVVESNHPLSVSPENEAPASNNITSGCGTLTDES